MEEGNIKLHEELEKFRSRKPFGRKKLDDVWMALYNDFIIKYEDGMTIMEVVNKGKISRRTAYRYKAYYEIQKINLYNL